MSENTKKIIALYNSERTSTQVAEILGLSARYVRRIAARYNLKRRGHGAGKGELNHQFVCGRRICHDGYVIVSAPSDHPNQRKRKNRKTGIILEHRLILEKKVGRYLLSHEVVDHIDGLTLHNHPDNLRLFQSNGDHLHETLKGRVPHWSEAGRQNIGKLPAQQPSYQPVDNYRLNKASGDVRLRQILLAVLSLGIDSPFLLGAHRHLAKAQIDISSRSKIERALDDLYQRSGLSRTL